mgnify:CR=1 FL=1
MATPTWDELSQQQTVASSLPSWNDLTQVKQEDPAEKETSFAKGFVEEAGLSQQISDIATLMNVGR